VQVNIQTPSAAGVSLNQYRQFDTGDAGTVLNNSRVNVQTQSAGWVAANPWLATGSARVIVNQVNSQNPSQLRGTLEVAGQRAEVIIANPAGLQVNGATFLNASRTVLTSGTPVINGGSLDGYRVSGGQVSIGGNGLDTSASDYTAILARSVEANAGIWAQQLQVGTGSQAYAADGSGQGALATSGPAPAFALDVAALGGMYAGKIVLVGTEHGLGVRNAGKLVAGAGGLRLQADGQLLNSGTLAATDAAADVQLQIGAVSNNGTLSSVRNLELGSSGALSNQGTLSAARQLTLNAAQIDNASSGAIDAQRLAITTTTLNNSGQLRQSGSQALALQAGQLQNSGSIGAVPAEVPPGSGASAGAGSGNAGATVVQQLPLPEGAPATGSSVQLAAPEVLTDGSVQVGGLLDNRGSLLANGGIDLATQGGLVNHGMLALGQLQVGGDRFDNSQGSLSAQAANIDTLSLSNQQGQLQIQGDAVLRSQAFDNRDGQIDAGGSLQLRSGQLDNERGSVVAGQALTVQGRALDNRDGTLASRQAGASLQLAAVDNQRGQLLAATSLQLSTSGALDNRQGSIQAAGVQMQVASVDNRGGSVAADTLSSHSGEFDNSGGLIQASQQLAIDTQGLVLKNSDSGSQRGILSGGGLQLNVGKLVNLAGGRIQAAGRLQLTSGDVLNQQASLSGGDLALEGGQLQNLGGQIQASGALSIDIRNQTLTNDAAGSIVSAGSLRLHAGTLINGTGSTIASPQSLQLQAASVRNAGLLASQAALQLQADGLDNRSGQLQAAILDIQLANGQLDNHQGLLLGSQALTLQAGNIDNRHTGKTDQGIQAGQLRLAAAGIDNSQGQLRSAGDSDIQLTAQFDNHDGTLASGGNLHLAVANADNTRGQLQAGQDLQLVADSLTGKGMLAANRDLGLQLKTDLELAGSTQAGRHLLLVTPGNLDHSGSLRAGSQASLQAAALQNQAGAEISAQALDITLASRLDNAGLIDGGQLTISAPAAIINQPGSRLYGDRVALATASLLNQSDASHAATIAARQDLQLGAAQLINAENSLIYSDGNLAIGGQLDSQHRATGSAQRVHNQSATIEAQGDMVIATDTLYNERLRTSITQQNSIDETVHMHLANWQGNGHNGGDLRSSANYRAYEILYLNPADILSNDIFITPDGKQLGRAIVKQTPQTSSFFFAAGRGWGATGERWRTTVPAETTRTIYYLGRQDAQASPDQLAGGDDPFAELTPTGGGGAPVFAYQYDGVQYSPQYGTCTNDCIQLVTQYQLEDPIHTIVYRIQHPSQEGGNEAARIAHHTAIDDVLAADAGAAAVIRAGGHLQVTPGQLLDNRYSQIAAGGSLLVDGSSEGQGSSKVVNTAATLYRLHQFSNTHITYSMGSYQGSAPDIRETLGSVAASIAANQALVINGGEASNLDQGRNAPHVQTPAAPGAEAANVRGGSDGIIHVTPPAGTMPGLVSTSSVNVTLPRSSLYHTTAASSPYLIQTDPAFTQYRQWLGSDYMLQAMAIDPATAQQRLGDGYYEQKLIRDQVTQLTGRRFLNGYASDEAQYRVLMDNGLTFARQYDLRPGVALSPEQMARLSSDIVWLVAQTVTLPDGSQKTALVPQVYVKLKPGDISADGALLAADRLQLKLAGDLANQGQIAGRQLLAINADNLHNLGGQLSGQDIALQARTDIHNLGGEVRASSSLQLAAGRDITVSSTTHSQQYGSGDNRLQQTSIERVAGLYVDGGAGVLLASAGRDLTLAGAQLANTGSGASVLQAGRDVNLATVSSSESRDVRWNATDRLHSSQQAETGTSIHTAGDLAIVAGQDLNARAANLASDNGAVALQAGRDLSLVNGENSSSVDWQTQSSKKGTFSSKTTNESYQRQQTDVVSSSVSGNSVSLQAGRDMAIQASQVVSDQAIRLQTGGNIAITSATASDSYSSQRDEKKSGLMSSGGLGFTIGKAAQGNANSVTTTRAVGSTLGSVQGDVSIQAGQAYRQTGSSVLTPQGDIDVQAQSLTIEEARQQTRVESSSYSKQSGLTVAISSPVVSAAQTVQGMQQAASQTGDARMQALAAASAGLATYRAAQDVVTQPGQLGGVTVSASIGSSRSSSQSTQSSDQAAASTLAAGGNLSLRATGAGQASDLTVQGSQLQAGGNALLQADDQITLQAARNTAEQHSRNSSSSGSIGVSWNTAAGLQATLAASQGRGHADGSDVTYSNTHVNAGQQLTLSSGGDTTLQGAVASGQNIRGDIGGQLRIDSLQDSSRYDSHQQNAGISAAAGTGSASGSVSAGNTRIDSDYLSVAEQSGLKAGDGGFQLTVKGDTTLTGSVIASSDAAVQAGVNRLDTAATHLSDLHNQASYNASGYSVNVGVSSGKPSGSAGIGQDSGSAASDTRAGISGIAGNSSVRSGDAETGIANPFDAQRVAANVGAQVAITAEFGRQAPRAWADFAQAQYQAAQASGNAEEAAKWAEGGAYRVAGHTVLGGLSGGVAGAAGAASSASLMPKLGEQLDSSDLPAAVKQAIGMVASATLGAVSGGAAGAAMGLNVDVNNRQLHPDEQQWLKTQAKDFAKRYGITEAQALQRLTRQALKEVDYLWRAQLADGDDAAAKAYLAQSKQTFVNDLGESQRLFTAGGQQLFRPEMFADTADVTFYRQFAQSGISRTLSAGLIKEMKDSGIALKDGTANLLTLAKDHPGVFVGSVWSAVKALPATAVAGFQETGMAIGEGAAVAFNADIKAKLNAIYGNDVASYQQAMLALRTISAVGSAAGVAGAGKAGGQLSREAALALEKKLDESLEIAARNALLKSGGLVDKQGHALLDMSKLTTEQKRVVGEQLFGPNTVRQIVPDGKQLARVQGQGSNGIDELYKVNRPDVDYVSVEYKFVGQDNKTGAQVLKNTGDGKQGSTSWIGGSGRIEKAVSSIKEVERIYDAIDAGRFESWVVTVRPDGSTAVEVLDGMGKAKPIDTSKLILPKHNLSGAKP